MLRERFTQALREAKNSALGVFDILAKKDDVGVILKPFSQRLVDRFHHCLGPRFNRRTLRRNFFTPAMVEHLFGNRIRGKFSFLIVGVYFGNDLVQHLLPALGCQFARGDELFCKQFDRVAILHFGNFIERSVNPVVVRTGVTAQAIEIHPKDCGAIAATRLFNGGGGGIVNAIQPPAIHLHHVILAHNPANVESKEMIGRRRNAVLVVFDHKDDGQFFLHRKCDRFIKLSLAAGGITHTGNDDRILPAELHRPSSAASGQERTTGWGADAENVALSVAVVSGHLTTTRTGVLLRKICDGQIVIGNTTCQHQGSTAVIREDPVILPETILHGSEGLVAHAAHLEPAFALAKKNPFASVAFSAKRH